MNAPRFVHLESVGSTQDVARTLPIGSVVMADYQTHGRGRLSHRWDSPPGSALLVSFVLQPNPLLSLAAGIAAAEAYGRGVRLKWPNDLLLDNSKVARILVNALPSRRQCLIQVLLAFAPQLTATHHAPRTN